MPACYIVTNKHLGYSSLTIWLPNYKDCRLLHQLLLQASFACGFPRNSVKTSCHYTAPNCRNTSGPTRVGSHAHGQPGKLSLKASKRIVAKSKKNKNETATKWTKKWTWRSAKRLNWQDWQAARQMPVTTTTRRWIGESKRERSRYRNQKGRDQRLRLERRVWRRFVLGTFFGSLKQSMIIALLHVCAVAIQLWY